MWRGVGRMRRGVEQKNGRKAGWLQTAAWMEVVAKVAVEAAWRRDATVQLYSGLLAHSSRGYEV